MRRDDKALTGMEMKGLAQGLVPILDFASDASGDPIIIIKYSSFRSIEMS